MTMTKDPMHQAAAQFGLTPEEADAHRQAWEDLGRLHVGAFCVETIAALFAALTQTQETGQPVDPATWRRLAARSAIIAAMAVEAEEQLSAEVFQHYQGPVH
jgi:hypothetical protein